MALTYDSIASLTSLSGQSVFTFNSIPSTYTDLVLVVTGTVSSGNSFYLQFNGAAGNAYNLTQTQMNNIGWTASNETNAAQFNVYGGMNSSLPSFYRVQIMSYASTSAFKVCLSEGSIDNNGTGIVNRVVGVWRSTSAITSMTGTTFGGTYGSGTTACLYGIKAA